MSGRERTKWLIVEKPLYHNYAERTSVVLAGDNGRQEIHVLKLKKGCLLHLPELFTVHGDVIVPRNTVGAVFLSGHFRFHTIFWSCFADVLKMK